MSGDLEPVHRNDLRASHEDRDATVDRLRIAAGDGRIDADELDQRIEAALSARTYGELAVIVRDLPESAEASARAVAKRAEAAEMQAITLGHGTTAKYGAWLVPQRLAVTAAHSAIVLDFTEAVFSGARTLEISCDLRHSAIKLIVPAGSTIESGDLHQEHSAVSLRNLGAVGAESVHIVLTGRLRHSSIKFRELGFMRRRARIRHAAAQRAIGRG